MNRPNNRLQELRKAAGLTQSELAEKTGVSVYSIRSWEHQCQQPTNVFHLYEMSKVLNCSIYDIVNLEK